MERPDDPPFGTPMETRYRQYNEYDMDAQEAEKEYKGRLKEIPWAPKKERRTEEYCGNRMFHHAFEYNPLFEVHLGVAILIQTSSKEINL